MSREQREVLLLRRNNQTFTAMKKLLLPVRVCMHVFLYKLSESPKKDSEPINSKAVVAGSGGGRDDGKKPSCMAGREPSAQNDSVAGGRTNLQ
jgi:hypothetical protein